MAKKRRGTKRAKARPTKSAQSKGFDFGCLPHAIAMSSFDFPNDLSEASIIAVAYGLERSDDVGQIIPSVSLVAQNPTALRRAFDTFHAWAAATDADSLEVTIVLRSAGGYVLALSPEVRRLERRCLGFDRTHEVVLFMATWCKPIDSVHPMLRKIQEYSKQPISPYLFGGAVLPGQVDAKNPPSPASVQGIPGLKPLLKFSISVIEESEVRPGSAASIALRMAEHDIDKDDSSKPRPMPADIAKRRRTMLRTHFPVTLERTAQSELAREPLDALTKKGVAAWQFEQAVCNLVLSASMNGGLHYKALPQRTFQKRVLQAVGERFEFGDGSPVIVWKAEEVERQILADTNALLKHLELKAVKDLASGQAMLRGAAALEASPALLGRT